MHSWKKKILLQSSVHLYPIFQFICNPMNIKVCIVNKAIKKFLKMNLNEDLLIILQLAGEAFKKHLIDDDDLDGFTEKHKLLRKYVDNRRNFKRIE